MTIEKSKVSVGEEYDLVLSKFRDYKEHGHLKLRFSFSHPETIARLKSEGYELSPVIVHGDMVYDIVAP